MSADQSKPIRVGDPVSYEVFNRVLAENARLRQERNEWMYEAERRFDWRGIIKGLTKRASTALTASPRTTRRD